ncbi:hypothetical protein ABPG77_006021 [Micractinium sp. CCAP 211/92]
MSLCWAGSAHGRHDAVEEGRRAAGRPVQAAWTRWMQRLASKAAMAVATGSAPGERCPARRRADASSAGLKGLLTASCYCLLLLQEAFELRNQTSNHGYSCCCYRGARRRPRRARR